MKTGILKIIFLTTINSIFGDNLMESVANSYETGIKLDDANGLFNTLHVLKIEDCAKLCLSTTSCKVGNYRRRGHFCKLTHTLGNVKYYIFRKRAGFVSWNKGMVEKVFTNDDKVCNNCTRNQSCVADKSKKTCDIYACSKPYLPTSFTSEGNVFTVNGKLGIPTCYNHENDVITYKTITCVDDAGWVGLDTDYNSWRNDCPYTKHTLSDGTTFSYKVFFVNVTQEMAMDRCKKDGANLTTIFTLEKLNFYRGMFMNGSITGGDYWIDAKRVAGHEWRTSDGRIQPMGMDIWNEFVQETVNDVCTRMRKEVLYKLDDWMCDAEFNYICERQT